MNAHSSLPPPSPTPFLKGEIKLLKNWAGRAIFIKLGRGNQKGESRNNTKVIEN